jgi:hypothetical protein
VRGQFAKGQKPGRARAAAVASHPRSHHAPGAAACRAGTETSAPPPWLPPQQPRCLLSDAAGRQPAPPPPKGRQRRRAPCAAAAAAGRPAGLRAALEPGRPSAGLHTFRDTARVRYGPRHAPCHAPSVCSPASTPCCPLAHLREQASARRPGTPCCAGRRKSSQRVRKQAVSRLKKTSARKCNVAVCAVVVRNLNAKGRMCEGCGRNGWAPWAETCCSPRLCVSAGGSAPICIADHNIDGNRASSRVGSGHFGTARRRRHRHQQSLSAADWPGACLLS